MGLLGVPGRFAVGRLQRWSISHNDIGYGLLGVIKMKVPPNGGPLLRLTCGLDGVTPLATTHKG